MSPLRWPFAGRGARSELADTAQTSGARAEEQALRHLSAAGLQLVARNLRFRGGEIDLLMREAEVLVVIEVRKRSHRGYGGAEASIDVRKRRRIVLATQLWLAAHDADARREVRFDVVTLDGRDQLQWLRSAFTVDDC